MERFGKKRLNDKLRFLFTVMILTLMIVTLLFSTILTVRSSFLRSKQEAESQVDFMKSSYDSWLTSADNLITALIMESETQEYCKTSEVSGNDYEEMNENLSNFLDSYKYINNDLNFIAVINAETGNYIYSGKGGGPSSYFFEKYYETNYTASQNAKSRGTLKMDYGYDYANGKMFTITFYFPVYSTTYLNREYGTVCVNFSDSLITSISQSGHDELCLTDANGIIVSTTDGDRLQGEEQLIDFEGNTEGTQIKNGKFYVYHKISDWNFYVVSIIPLSEIYLSSVRTVILTIVLTAVMIFLALAIMRKIIERSYQPMERVVGAMDSVLENSLDLRIETEDMGEDFERLGSGFNHMMDDIQTLMEQLLEEQREANQIRLNALQSQIQPHFLYNTLDTIHWQARMDGNDEMSELVMALAKYYRICLSKGKDIIPLSEELEQISCYLLIQNKRYDDIIRYEMRISEEFMQVKIAKLTLQPLVENSIYHGIRVKEGISGTVCLNAEKKEGKVIIKVCDSGQGMTQEQIDEINNSISNYSEEFGYGVRNVNRRLELMFGEEYGLHYCINEVGGVTVEILLPEEYIDKAGSIFNGGR